MKCPSHKCIADNFLKGYKVVTYIKIQNIINITEASLMLQSNQ